MAAAYYPVMNTSGEEQRLAPIRASQEQQSPPAPFCPNTEANNIEEINVELGRLPFNTRIYPSAASLDTQRNHSAELSFTLLKANTYKFLGRLPDNYCYPTQDEQIIRPSRSIEDLDLRIKDSLKFFFKVPITESHSVPMFNRILINLLVKNGYAHTKLGIPNRLLDMYLYRNLYGALVHNLNEAEVKHLINSIIPQFFNEDVQKTIFSNMESSGNLLESYFLAYENSLATGNYEVSVFLQTITHLGIIDQFHEKNEDKSKFGLEYMIDILWCNRSTNLSTSVLAYLFLVNSRMRVAGMIWSILTGTADKKLEYVARRFFGSLIYRVEGTGLPSIEQCRISIVRNPHCMRGLAIHLENFIENPEDINLEEVESQSISGISNKKSAAEPFNRSENVDLHALPKDAPSTIRSSRLFPHTSLNPQDPRVQILFGVTGDCGNTMVNDNMETIQLSNHSTAQNSEVATSVAHQLLKPEVSEVNESGALSVANRSNDRNDSISTPKSPDDPFFHANYHHDFNSGLFRSTEDTKFVNSQHQEQATILQKDELTNNREKILSMQLNSDQFQNATYPSDVGIKRKKGFNIAEGPRSELVSNRSSRRNSNIASENRRCSDASGIAIDNPKTEHNSFSKSLSIFRSPSAKAVSFYAKEGAHNNAFSSYPSMGPKTMKYEPPNKSLKLRSFKNASRKYISPTEKIIIKPNSMASRHSRRVVSIPNIESRSNINSHQDHLNACYHKFSSTARSSQRVNKAHYSSQERQQYSRGLNTVEVVFEQENINPAEFNTQQLSNDSLLCKKSSRSKSSADRNICQHVDKGQSPLVHAASQTEVDHLNSDIPQNESKIFNLQTEKSNTFGNSIDEDISESASSYHHPDQRAIVDVNESIRSANQLENSRDTHAIKVKIDHENSVDTMHHDASNSTASDNMISTILDTTIIKKEFEDIAIETVDTLHLSREVTEHDTGLHTSDTNISSAGPFSESYSDFGPSSFSISPKFEDIQNFTIKDQQEVDIFNASEISSRSSPELFVN